MGCREDVILPALELSMLTLYNIGKWTLQSLKHLYAVLLPHDYMVPYSALGASVGISSVFSIIFKPNISWDYLDSLTTPNTAQVHGIWDSDRRLETQFYQG